MKSNYKDLIELLYSRSDDPHSLAAAHAIECLSEKVDLLEHDIKASSGGYYVDLTKVSATNDYGRRFL